MNHVFFLVPTLFVPPFPATRGWVYEAWVTNTVTMERVSLGKFANSLNSDFDAATWGGRGSDNSGFPAPGQDFVTAQAGTVIPLLDLNAGFTAMISVEPFPDSSPLPFLTVLSGPIPAVGSVVPPLQNQIAGNPAALPSGFLSF